MKYDDLVESLGEFGPYQRKVYILSCLPAAVAAVQTLVTVFTLAVPDHRCAIPGLLDDKYSDNSIPQQKLINWTLPWTDLDPDDDTNPWGSGQCNVYTNRNVGNLDSSPASADNKTSGCKRWTFDQDVFDDSFVTEANLVCDDLPLKSHANSIYMAGLLVGSITMGILSDRKGRKTAILVSLVVQISTAIGVAFVKDWWLFVTLRFFTATGNMGLFMCSFVLAMELVGRSWRTFAGVAIQLFWCLGMFLLTAVAYVIRNWVDLQLATSVYAVLLITLWWVMPESPRWLLTQGRVEEAKSILLKVAAANGKVLPKDAFEKLDLSTDVKNEDGNEATGADDAGLLAICSYPVLAFRMFVLFINWFVVVMVYYGLTLNVGSLGGSIYLNFFLSGLVEALANVVTIYALPRFGRKRFHCFSMLVGGLANVCFLLPTLIGGDDLQWPGILLSNIGKFGATGGFSTIYVYTAELFPTRLRNSVVGSSSMVARVGGIVSPYIADLGPLVGGKFGNALPYVVFGVSGLLAGLLALMLPETLHQRLPETIQDAVHFGKNKVTSAEGELPEHSSTQSGMEDNKQEASVVTVCEDKINEDVNIISNEDASLATTVVNAEEHDNHINGALVSKDDINIAKTDTNIIDHSNDCRSGQSEEINGERVGITKGGEAESLVTAYCVDSSANTANTTTEKPDDSNDSNAFVNSATIERKDNNTENSKDGDNEVDNSCNKGNVCDNTDLERNENMDTVMTIDNGNTDTAKTIDNGNEDITALGDNTNLIGNDNFELQEGYVNPAFIVERF